MEMRVARLEGDAIDTESTRNEFLSHFENFSRVEWKPKKKPTDAHTVPFVTGKHYHISWETPEDFTDFKIEVSKRWQEDDDNTYFTTNHTSQREEFSIKTAYGNKDGMRIANGTLQDYESE